MIEVQRAYELGQSFLDAEDERDPQLPAHRRCAQV
jgi:flagellar basal body rod protein FlgG